MSKKKNNESYYAVANGRCVGIFRTWDECNEQVKGFPSAKYKKFDKETDANTYIEENKPCTSSVGIPYDYVYTDGACIHNGKTNSIAGYGIYFGENDPRNTFGRILGDKQTNNVAELTAILKTYAIIEADIVSGKPIIIVSDSSYALSCVGYYGRRCYEGGWQQDIPNKELVRETYELYRNHPNVQFMYIAAHTNYTDNHSIGNARADKLATRAIS